MLRSSPATGGRCLLDLALSVRPAPGPALARPRLGCGQGWTGPLGPESRRRDCMMANVVVVVKISMSAAASTPGYLAMMGAAARSVTVPRRSEEQTSELQSLRHLVCRLLL